MQIPPDEPLAIFNVKYQQIHQVAYNISSDKQTDKTVIIDYAKKLPHYPRYKLLKKLSRKDSYIKTLQDAFRSEVEINREMSFVHATTGRSGETKISQINKLDDSFPDYYPMSTRSTNRSGDRSFDRSFDRSSSRSGSQNSSYNSRSNFRYGNNSFTSSSSTNQSRQSFGQKHNTQPPTFQPRNSRY